MARCRCRCRLLALALLALTGALGLRDVKITVPAHVLRGRSARLACHYQLDGERLYSVKWYKGRHEFYRFTPSEQPFKKAFPPLGAHVDLRQSGGGHVTLTAADESVAGRYSCEVSADAPSFHTMLVSGNLEVVDAPRQRPQLVGVRSRYQPGDWLNATCTAGASRPPAALAFLVNDVKQDERSTQARAPLEEGASGLWRSRLALALPVTSALGPRVRVRCVASIGAVYWQSAERSAAVGTGPRHRHPPESSGDGHGPADDDGGADDSELELEVEEGQGEGEGRRQPQPQPASTAAPWPEETAAGAGTPPSSCGCGWWLVGAALAHLWLHLHLHLRLHLLA